jgi:glucose-1-phosphate thymidylyltransferase
MARPVGLLPAAGRGVRFGSSGYDKELFPLLIADGAGVRLRPICELSLETIAACGADRCVVVVSPQKDELMRVLADVRALKLAFVVQPEPTGLPAAIGLAAPWLGEDDVVLALPDTIVLPPDALARVHAKLAADRADIALGVFPVDEPERLGPIDLDGEGNVLRIHDKPGNRSIMNSWAIAAWTSRFTRFCGEWAETRRGQGAEPALGHAFAAALAAGFRVRAAFFERGTFLDIGTPVGLRTALRELADRALVESAQSDLLHRPR